MPYLNSVDSLMLLLMVYVTLIAVELTSVFGPPPGGSGMPVGPGMPVNPGSTGSTGVAGGTTLGPLGSVPCPDKDVTLSPFPAFTPGGDVVLSNVGYLLNQSIDVSTITITDSGKSLR